MSLSIHATWWTQPYPETIKRYLPKKPYKPAIYQHISFVGIKKTLLLLSAAFLLAGLAFSLFAGSFIMPWELFINTPLYSAQGFYSLFTPAERVQLGSSTLQNITVAYYIISLVFSIYAVFLFEKKVIGTKRVKTFSMEWFTRTFLMFSLAFMCDNLVALLVKIIGVGILGENTPATMIVSFIIGMGGNFLFYFILNDIMSELIILVSSMFVISVLENTMNIPGGLMQFYALTIMGIGIKFFTDKSGLTRGISRFVSKWAYTPKYIWRATLWFYFIFLYFVFPKRRSDD